MQLKARLNENAKYLMPQLGFILTYDRVAVADPGFPGVSANP